MSEIITVGLDLAKNVFQVHGADASGRPKFDSSGANLAGVNACADRISMG